MLVCRLCEGRGFVPMMHHGQQVKITLSGRGGEQLGILWRPCDCQEHAAAANQMRRWLMRAVEKLEQEDPANVRAA